VKAKHNRPTAESVLKTVGTNRRNNLRRLIGEGRRFTTQVDLASTLGVTDSYLSQLLGPNPIRRVTEPTARKFEYKLGLRTGSLDHAAE
jgi:hypothetical protein